MRYLGRALLCLLACLPTLGCLQTRHVKATSVSTCDGVSGASCREATCSERRWCGFWPCLPSRVEP